MKKTTRTQKFSKKEAVKFGWKVMKENLGFFIGILLVTSIPGIIDRGITVITKQGILPEHSLFLSSLSLIIGIIVLILYVVFELGFIKIALGFCDNKKGKFSDLFSCFPLFFKYLFGSILYTLIVFGGLILLIVPGIIWGIKFQFFGYFIVDKGFGPIESLKKSAALTKGAKWDLLLFGLLLVAINLLGLICLIIGLFATIPLTMVAVAFVYRQLLARVGKTV